MKKYYLPICYGSIGGIIYTFERLLNTDMTDTIILLFLFMSMFLGLQKYIETNFQKKTDIKTDD